MHPSSSSQSAEKQQSLTKDKEPSSSRIKKLFQTDERLGLSRFRFYLLRGFYGMIVLLLGINVWTHILTQDLTSEPLPAIAYSFWAAFSALAILGIVNPIRMIPLLLAQFSYKLLWLIIIAYPLWRANELAGSSAEVLTKANFTGIILDLLVIPWSFVFKNYFRFKEK